jgi:ATP synthase protein I
MPEYQVIFTQVRKYILFLLALFVLAWGFSPQKTIFLGLILGTSLSLFNLWILTKKMDRFSAAMEQGRAMRSFGFLSRVATAVFAVIIAMNYPEYFHLISVIIGLMTAYIVIMINSFVQHFRVYK